MVCLMYIIVNTLHKYYDDDDDDDDNNNNGLKHSQLPTRILQKHNVFATKIRRQQEVRNF